MTRLQVNALISLFQEVSGLWLRCWMCEELLMFGGTAGSCVRSMVDEAERRNPGDEWDEDRDEDLHFP